MKISLFAFAALQIPVATFAATVKNLVIFGDSNSGKKKDKQTKKKKVLKNSE